MSNEIWIGMIIGVAASVLAVLIVTYWLNIKVVGKDWLYEWVPAKRGWFSKLRPGAVIMPIPEEKAEANV